MKTLLPPPARSSSGRVLAACLAALFLAGSALAEDTRVILSMEVTPAGKKIPTPTPGHPVYYLPDFAGYKEMGPPLNFYERKPASEDAVRQALTQACIELGLSGPEPQARQFRLEMNGVALVWERHGEFITHSLEFAADSEDPFSPSPAALMAKINMLPQPSATEETKSPVR